MPVDFKYCASYSFAFRQLPELSNFRRGFPQYCRTCMPGCQCALDDCTSHSRLWRQYLSKTALWCMMLFLRSTRPLLFHGHVISTPTKCVRFPTLRSFNLSLSKRRCQGQEQIHRGTWLVERRSFHKPRVVTRHSGVSYACLLVPVVRRSPSFFRPPSQTVIAYMCHILSCPHIHRPRKRSSYELGRNTIPC